MDRKLISRRDFIKAAGVAAGASLLAACAPQATPTAAPTSVSVSPTEVPPPAVMDVWWNTDVPDLAALADWKQDPDNELFKKMWNWGGLARAKFQPFVDAHPGVTLKITTH